jgi:hypothetical protein
LMDSSEWWLPASRAASGPGQHMLLAPPMSLRCSTTEPPHTVVLTRKFLLALMVVSRKCSVPYILPLGITCQCVWRVLTRTRVGVSKAAPDNQNQQNSKHQRPGACKPAAACLWLTWAAHCIPAE